MRIKRIRAATIDPIFDPEPVPAGAIRAVEPEFEQLARVAHVVFLVHGSRQDAVAQSMDAWLARSS
jgi:hypothetical protein